MSETPEQHQSRCFGVSIVNFDEMQHIGLVFPCSNVDFKQKMSAGNNNWSSFMGLTWLDIKTDMKLSKCKWIILIWSWYKKLNT